MTGTTKSSKVLNVSVDDLNKDVTSYLVQIAALVMTHLKWGSGSYYYLRQCHPQSQSIGSNANLNDFRSKLQASSS
jgi:hypothetical protein